jgi:molybdopterin-guanine dinucleotide biosynthesis protein A
VDVVVLAGGETDAALRELGGTDQRALLPYKGRPMVETVLDAVQHLGTPIVVASFDVPRGRRVPAGKGFVESMANGLNAVTTEAFLLVTSDIPWVTAEAVDDLIARSDPDALLNYPIIAAEDAERQFPGTTRTTLRLKEGEFTGGNAAVVKTSLMREAMPHLERAYANRKKVLALGAQVGWSTLFSLIKLKLLPGSVSVARFEADLGKFLGGRICAVRTPFAGLGTDVDNAEQYAALLRDENSISA